MKLIIVGKHDSSSPLLKLIRDLGIGEHVRLLHPRPDIQTIFHAIDLCVHPALIEEFGQVVQEAVMCGTPVLTSRRVGATDLFPACQATVVLENPDPANLVKAWQMFAASSERRHRHWQATYETMQTNTWAENFRLTMAAIRTVSTAVKLA